jgi:hypothetical protein
MTTMALLYHSGAYTDLYDTKLSIFYIESVVSSTNKTDHHNITEILLKVALNTIAITSIYHSVKDSSFVTFHAEKAFYSQLFATLLYTQL